MAPERVKNSAWSEHHGKETCSLVLRCTNDHLVASVAVDEDSICMRGLVEHVLARVGRNLITLK